MTVDLAMPPKGGRRIAKLQGAVRMAVPLKVETLEIGDVLSATEVTRTVGGRRLVFRKARKIKGGYEAIVTLYRGNLDDAQWQQWTNPKEDVRLLDAKGLVIRFTGVSEMETAERQSTLSLQFENPNNAPEGIVGPVGKPAKLAWDVPVTSREIRIPFEFRDLPFP
jgi:hypothetical protein